VDVPLGSEVPYTFLCQVNFADIDHQRLGRFQTLPYLARHHSSVDEFLADELLAEGIANIGKEGYAQLKLIDLLLDRGETNLLPKAGLLSFFYDTVMKPWGFDSSDSNSCKVIYTPPDITAEAVSIPDGLFDEYLPDRLLAPEHQSVIKPDPECMAQLRSGAERPYDARWEPDEVLEFLTGWEPTHQEREAGAPMIRLFGKPDIIQNDCLQHQAECLLRGQSLSKNTMTSEEVRIAKEQWVMLLEVNSLESCGLWHWGNLNPGNIYFMIRRDHLAVKDFSHVKVVLQCG